MKKNLLLVPFLIAFVGCDSLDDSGNAIQGEKITRLHHEKTFQIEEPQKIAPPSYSWEEVVGLPKITKEFFRCKGDPLNPPREVEVSGEKTRYFDCYGGSSHSLPLRNGKEFIYPILLNLINFLQEQTGKKVVITSGHRCPEHNTYVDYSKENRCSKHQMGAEVSFYVKGLENSPEKIVALLKKYYSLEAEYEGQKDYIDFERWEKSTNVSTLPWMNKEIFIKLYKKNEGRNLDNKHLYPYLSVQVRYDREAGKKVQYSWDEAFRNYMR